MIWQEILVFNVAGMVLFASGTVIEQIKPTKLNRKRYGEGIAVSGIENRHSNNEENTQSLKKIWMLEKQLKLLRNEVKDLNSKLDLLNNVGSSVFADEDIVENPNDEKKIDKKGVNDWNKIMLNKEYLKRLAISFLKENFNQLKGEIVDELHDKLKREINLETNVKRTKRAIRSPETDNFDFLNTAEGFETETGYDNDFHHKGHESALDRQLHKLTKIIEAELNQYQTNINNEGPAINNEFPETKSVVQSDGGFGLSIEKIFDMLRGEVRNALQQQSRNVKLTLNKHLDSVETKMTQILTLMEGMKSSYDKKFDNLLPTSITNGNRRIEQIETDIASLEQGITSLRENVIGDPNIQEHLQQIKDELQEEISKQVHPVRRNIHELRERVQTNMRQHGVTETSFQNFKADMREKVHFIELDVTKLESGLKNMNSSVKSNLKKSKSCAAENAKIMEAFTFVEEIRLEWPSIWTNITNIEELSRTNLRDANLKISNIETDFDRLSQNQTGLQVNIKDFRNSLDDLSIRINKIKQVNIKLALEYDEWVEFNFKHSEGHSSCLRGKKYIKKTNYKAGKYVAVLLCSSTRYKIYLGDSIGGKFLDIGDSRNFGEDHCEFVGGTRSSKIKVGKWINWFRRMEGYKRANWGDPPVKGILSFFTPSPPWYECGVSIP